MINQFTVLLGRNKKNRPEVPVNTTMRQLKIQTKTY